MRKILIVLVALFGLSTIAACSEVADSKTVGLWYAVGQLEGNVFDHCIKPGTVDDTSFNDEVYWVPNDLRTWNVAAVAGPGVDSTTPLTVTAKPAEGQTSGLEVNVYTQTNLMLNTWCGKDEKDAASPLVQWWQRIGDRYDADTADGWMNMLGATIVPALEKAKNTLRTYTADQLVLGEVWTEAEAKFSASFMAELERLSGGEFFCGPTFNRTRPDCPDVAVSIKDVDYKDPGIQKARNEKQAAVERAAAAVAEAEGRVRAAAAQNALYQNQEWVMLQLAQIELEKAKACANAANCTIVLDASGEGTQVHVGGR